MVKTRKVQKVSLIPFIDLDNNNHIRLVGLGLSCAFGGAVGPGQQKHHPDTAVSFGAALGRAERCSKSVSLLSFAVISFIRAIDSAPDFPRMSSPLI